MILMIDWGNTQLKILKCDLLTQESLVQGEQFRVDGVAQLVQLLDENYQHILVASVRNEQDNNQLRHLLQTKSASLFFAKTSPEACGVSCGYQNYQLLGVDRWLGLIAVASAEQTVGLISIGTAITLDIITDKQHMGGHIVPGRRLMFESLLNTGQVRPAVSESLKFDVQLGHSTSDCVNFGIDAAINGYLQSIIESLESKYQIKHWVLTGGGGKYWYDQLKTTSAHYSHNPFVVFIGLVKLYLKSLNN